MRVHRCRDLHPEHIRVVGALDATTIERALVDVATCFSGVRVEWLLDHLTITTRRTSLGRIARVLRQINHRGRTGIGLFTALLTAFYMSRLVFRTFYGQEKWPVVPAPEHEDHDDREQRRLAAAALIPLMNADLVGLQHRAGHWGGVAHDH